MALSKDFNVDPYYDDFSADKSFHRILFRPGFAVQAREVTQLQTILQKQIERYGQHTFRDGSKVLGGELTLDTDVNSLKLETQFSGTNINVASFGNGIITGASSNARAKIVATQAATTTTQPTVMFHYLSSKSFSDGETLTMEGTSTQANTVSSGGASGLANSVAGGSVVSIDSGVFFVGGYFVFNTAETLILDAYSGTPSYRVGMGITESIKSSDDDSSLLDPASGSYNYAAPGATRYKVELALSKQETTSSDPVTAAASENFIQLLKVAEGIKQEEVKYPILGELDKTLARRTYDESGDYTITPFNIELASHKGVSGLTISSGGSASTGLFGNNTLFTTEVAVGDVITLGSNTTTSIVSAITNTTHITLATALDTHTAGQSIYLENKFSSGLDPGKAYVKGYEYESIATKYVTTDKGRATETTTNYAVSSEFGNYTVLKEANGFFNTLRNEICDLHCASTSSINLTSNTTYLATKIGTARIRSMDYEEASGNASSSTSINKHHTYYRSYFWDVRTQNNITGTVGSAQANTLLVVLPTATSSYVNGVYDSSSITVNTVSGVDSSSDTRTIDQYFVNSTGHFAICNTVLSQSTIANSTFDLDFKFKDTDSVVVGALGAPPTINSQAEIANTGRYNNSDTGNTILRQTQINTLLYTLPQSPIANTKPTGANTVEYLYKSVVTAEDSDADGTISITLSDNQRFRPSSGTLNATNARENFVVVVSNSNSSNTFQNAAGSTGKTSDNTILLSNGMYFDLGAVNSSGSLIRPITISGTTDDESRKTVTIECNTSAAFTADIIYTAESSSTTGSSTVKPGPRIKTLTTGNGTHILTYDSTTPANTVTSGQFSILVPNITPGSTDLVPVSDAFNIVKVVDSGKPYEEVTNAMMTQTANDVSHFYDLENGQADNFYDYAKIRLKPGYPGPQGRIMVVVDYFTWDTGTGYHSVDSYPTSGNYDNVNTTSNSAFSYSTIPSYTSPTTGKTYQLRDVLDFRPRRENATNTANNDLTANSTAIEGIPLPDPEGTVTSTFSYYLPRIDKLALTKDRAFKVIKGESALKPIAAPDDEDSMTLYVMNVPAYTFALTDITTKYIDNRRYTMRDIGKLEKRIERVEYYTALTMLEKETSARDFTRGGGRDSLFNPKGAAFKNGMLIDPFAGHSVGDIQSDDYNISIEYATKEMRPPFYYDNFRFTYNSAKSNNVTKTGDLVTLPYSDVDFIEQPLTDDTVRINPFNIVNFIGTLKPTPPSDTWFDDSTRPQVISNREGQNDNWKLSPNTGRKGFGSQWDDWSLNWSGKQITEDPEDSVRTAGDSTEGKRSTKEMADSKSRFGISANNAPESIMKTVGQKMTDVSVVPFVRGQTIMFTAKGLKPLTNVYVFFGDQDVGSQVRPATKLVLSGANAVFQEGELVKDSANNKATVLLSTNTVSNVATIYLANMTGDLSATAGSPVTANDANRTANVGNSTVVFGAANVVNGISSSANATIATTLKFDTGITNGIMQTTDKGEVAGELTVSAGLFRSGDRILRITDDSTNNVAAATTVAESFFPSKGILQTREKGLISTREAVLRRERIQEEDLTTDTTKRQTTKTSWLNPLCQTFHVDPSVFPLGLFLRNVGLYFSAKDSFLPVSVQIRPISGGFPHSSRIIPFSEKILHPDSINTSNTANAADATTMTSFVFDSPVYLPPDEYAIVILSNSTEYIMYRASEGANSTGTTSKISKPAFVGSYYRPQNAGIWDKKTDEYLMFKLQRADFTGAGGDANFVKLENHSNGASGNTANSLIDIFKVTGSTINFSNTSLDFKYASSNSGTDATTENSGTVHTYYAMSIDQNYKLTDQKRIKTGANGSFRVKAEMSTSNSHISPVIDIDRMNMITIENSVDNAGLSNSDITVTTRGSGYINAKPQAVTATISGGGATTTATVNVHVGITLNCSSNSTSVISANGAYTVDGTNPGAFLVGEAVMGNTSGSTDASQSGFYGVIDSVTHLLGNTSKNVSSITIKTDANNSVGNYVNGMLIWANANAKGNAATTLGPSGTQMIVLTANGTVSNVVVITSGGGYTETPTVTLPTVSAAGSVNAAASVASEIQNKGGPITAKYVSRRVSLKDEFDASDLKVVLSAYKPKGTNIYVYYKIMHADDPDDFDSKNYVIMSQETTSGTYSGKDNEILEFTYKTPTEAITYSSSGVLYDTFKTFSIKIALVAETTYDMPRVRDMRAIALD